MKLRYYMRGLGIGILVTAVLMAVTMHGKTESLTDEQIIERAEALGMEMKYSSDVLADTISDNTAKKDAEAAKEDALPEQVKEETSLANQLQAEEKEENPLLAGAGVEDEDAAQEAAEADDSDQDVYHADPDAAERTEAKDAQTDSSAEEETKAENATDVQDESTADDTKQADAAGSSAADTDAQAAAGSNQITVSSGDGSDTVARKLYEAGLVSDAAAYDRYLCQNGYDKKICTGVKTIPAGATEAEIAKILTTR